MEEGAEIDLDGMWNRAVVMGYALCIVGYGREGRLRPFPRSGIRPALQSGNWVQRRTSFRAPFTGLLAEMALAQHYG